MAKHVSVPEKTLEHWLSQYILYRFRSNARLWWPARGVDIAVLELPVLLGKAVSFEVKTTSYTDARLDRHRVEVDLGQLWDYSRRPLALQPFYVFPFPDWQGKLRAVAALRGVHPSDIAFSRSGAAWWFANWMSVLTTRQVANVLAAELAAHGSGRRGTKKTLLEVIVPVAGPGVPSWGHTGTALPPPALDWRPFWDELVTCGRRGWPQLLDVPGGELVNGTLSYEELRIRLQQFSALVRLGEADGVAATRMLAGEEGLFAPIDEKQAAEWAGPPNDDRPATDESFGFAVHLAAAALFT